MKIHKNLLWVQGKPELVEQLLKDRVLSRLIVAKPSSEVFAVQYNDYQKFKNRLKIMDQHPQEIGEWQ